MKEVLIPKENLVVVEIKTPHDHIHDDINFGTGACTKCGCKGFFSTVGGDTCDNMDDSTNTYCGHSKSDHR